MSITMLYKAPGKHLLDGHAVNYVVVPDAQVDAKLAEGWSRTIAEAVTPVEEPAAEDIAPPTRAELEQKAAELGLKVDGRWSDNKLAEKIAETLKA